MKREVGIRFENGTLAVNGVSAADLPPELFSVIKADSRTGSLRARACDYAKVVIGLQTGGFAVRDEARNFAPIELTLAQKLIPRPHQEEALKMWRQNSFRGIAALPTGAGKTVLAVMAIHALQRPALVLVPTIDLLLQWTAVLEKFFGTEVGMLGGGERKILPLTVSTYDSAVLNMEFIGNRFALLIADECHHLPAPNYRLAAAMCIAPYRLGLSATPEMEPDREEVMEDMLGEVVCRIAIGDLEGSYLSSYETRRINIPLEVEEAVEYRKCREIYTGFLRSNRITFRHNSDWGRFLGLCAGSAHGKKVLEAFFTQRRIARCGRAKFAMVRELISRHALEKIIVFTADNASAYRLGRELILPVITHHTGAGERKSMLENFRNGTFPVLVTSKVLNEGVDVPDAGVGIVLSGSASVREHVQRLGRILRPSPGKAQAVLYELVSEGTSEESVSERRRDHQAYQGR